MKSSLSVSYLDSNRILLDSTRFSFFSVEKLLILKGPAIRFKNGPSIRYIGPKFRLFYEGETGAHIRPDTQKSLEILEMCFFCPHIKS